MGNLFYVHNTGAFECTSSTGHHPRFRLSNKSIFGPFAPPGDSAQGEKRLSWRIRDFDSPGMTTGTSYCTGMERTTGGFSCAATYASPPCEEPCFPQPTTPTIIHPSTGGGFMCVLPVCLLSNKSILMGEGGARRGRPHRA